ncbi:unnamed protein product, partial [marine sediment metagenome]
MNSQNIPSTGGLVNVPGVPGVNGVVNNQVYKNGPQGQQSVPNGAVQASQNGTYSVNPSRAYVNHVLMPCAKAVAKWVPILQRQGINITEQVVLEKIFLNEFQIAAEPIRSLPATGIRAPKTKSRSRVPGSVRI